MLLALLALGFAAYAVWRFVQAYQERGGWRQVDRIVGAGVWNLYRGITRKFEEGWRMHEMSERERKWGGRAGLFGHLARAVVFALIGIFVMKAAFEFDPKNAIGLDGALQKLAGAGYGP